MGVTLHHPRSSSPRMCFEFMTQHLFCCKQFVCVQDVFSTFQHNSHCSILKSKHNLACSTWAWPACNCVSILSVCVCVCVLLSG